MKNSQWIIVVLMFAFYCTSAQKTYDQSKPTAKDQYQKKVGNLNFSKVAIQFGKLKNNAVQNDSVYIFNSGTKPIKIFPPSETPVYFKARFIKTTLAPSEKGLVIFTYDASKRNDYGFVYERYSFQTDDSLVPLKILQVSAIIEEYFPPMSAEDSVVAPRSRMSEIRYNYGSIKQGDKIKHAFVIYNDGQNDLVIRKAKASTVSIEVQLSKNTIVKGDSALINIQFNTTGLLGKDSRKVNLYLNDPRKTELQLLLFGEIHK